MRRTVIAMSGGVDSAVAASFARARGDEVLGVTLRMFGPAPEGAQAVCARLGIPFEVWDVREAFEREVLAPFAAAYRAGRTPNPCVLCNRAVKLGALLREGTQRGFERIVTGHYACVRREGETVSLWQGADEGKDQSYVLCMLPPDLLAALELPLGALDKQAVRALAREAGFAGAADSQDICFVPDGDYAAFLARRGEGLTPGRFVLADGRDLGPHGGLERYTVGQRRGLGVAWEHPLYVLEKRACGTVVLGEEAALWQPALRAGGLNWLVPPPCGPLRAQARIRYHQRQSDCTLVPLADGTAEVRFDAPVRAPAPGQTVAFYDGARVLGGGTIL